MAGGACACACACACTRDAPLAVHRHGAVAHAPLPVAQHDAEHNGLPWGAPGCGSVAKQCSTRQCSSAAASVPGVRAACRAGRRRNRSGGRAGGGRGRGRGRAHHIVAPRDGAQRCRRAPRARAGLGLAGKPAADHAARATDANMRCSLARGRMECGATPQPLRIQVWRRGPLRSMMRTGTWRFAAAAARGGGGPQRRRRRRRALVVW